MQFSIFASMLVLNWLMVIDEKAIVFFSQGGKTYSCNPIAISENLHNSYPEYKIIWLFLDVSRPEGTLPKYIIPVRIRSFKALKVLATAKFWLTNHNIPHYFYKGKSQIYIQTWHGDRGFKRIFADNIHFKGPMPIEQKVCDLFVVGSYFAEKKIKTAFDYNGKFLKFGCPRNDILLDATKEKIITIKKTHNIDEDSMVLLYAPTFRDKLREKNSKQTIYNLNLTKIVQTLEIKHRAKWVCFIRSHQFSDGIIVPELPGDVFLNGNQFEDMNDLLLISDMLISDYSSSAGDFVLMNKAVLLYQPDQNLYNYERGLYFNPDESPFLIAKNNKDLLNIIENLEQKTILDNCRKVLAFYGAYESGKASKEVVDYITNH